MIPAGVKQPALRWLSVLFLTAAFVYALGLLALPGHALLGALAAGMIVAIRGRAPAVPSVLFRFGQSAIGCLVASSFDGEALREVAGHGILFFSMVLTVFLVCAGMGWMLAKKRVLPGTTAIWGTSPGGASIMTVLSGDFGADSRLVALMQYSRVLMVTFVAIAVARLHGADVSLAQGAARAAPPFAWEGFLVAAALCCAGVAAGGRLPVQSAAILIPLAAGTAVKAVFGMEIAVPWWMLLGANLAIGWSIGFRFTARVLADAYRALPHIVFTFVGMIALCGAAGVGLGYLAGIDPLTAYLATSPGGMDVIALIAVSAGGNAPFVMAVQLARFLVTLATGPRLAAYVAARMNRTEGVTKR